MGRRPLHPVEPNRPVVVRIDRRTLRHVDRLAERLGISRSALIRRSVAKLLADTKSGADSAA